MRRLHREEELRQTCGNDPACAACEDLRTLFTAAQLVEEFTDRPAAAQATLAAAQAAVIAHGCPR